MANIATSQFGQTQLKSGFEIVHCYLPQRKWVRLLKVSK